MVRNRDIRGFFVAKSSAGSSQPEATTSSPAATTQDQQLPSSPRTPPRSAVSAAASRRLGPQDEVMGSDDEEDSDDSLESLSALIGGGPAAYRRPPNDGDMTSTPRAKRIASGSGELRGSPLTLQQRQQQHKFDLKALISHTRQSERTEESARRAEELIRGAEDSSSSDEGDGGRGSPSNDLKQVARELLDRDGNENDDEEGNPRGDKIARAIDRTQVQGARRRCYFFDPTAPPPPPQQQQQPFSGPASARAPPFPVDAARGPWRFLADPNTRDQAIINGLPHTVVASRGKELPEELFLWMLDSVCAERNPRLRAQHCGLLVACAGNTRRLVDGARLYGALERIGGPKYDPRPAKLKTSPEVEEPYGSGGRNNWAGLGAFLDLLRRMAPNLEPASAVDGVKLLLRMGLDPVLGNAVRGEHLAALEALVTALPATEEQWNAACADVCSYVLQSLDDAVLRMAALSSIPKSTARLADLRRRLAAAVLFSSSPGDFDVANLDLGAAAVQQRLSRPDFAIRPTTDFEELRALVWLLDAAVGDASCFLFAPPPPKDDPPDDDGNRAGQERRSRFDADVDALTFRLRALHDGIHDNGLLARKEAKAAIDAVSKRLTYAVRTRPPAKTSIFDPPARDDVDLPRQRDFMKNWAQRRRAETSSPAVV
ncbi:hypothetical protein DL766_000435 [Monosporascus sp. MC13-8B]|uniref:Formin GTPase-binding domain-containing protein n=1 Tax=Monosporascus cannonballus TaxID=155416 RepID=A0ABY0HBF7_9PEZI|nr:hypothetical protein DL762_003138 [Monosporascus cannonballus]RYP39410.1 hypothetical protein DL766_000435 [Monosporascus sp. MC13-8B]